MKRLLIVGFVWDNIYSVYIYLDLPSQTVDRSFHNGERLQLQSLLHWIPNPSSWWAQCTVIPGQFSCCFHCHVHHGSMLWIPYVVDAWLLLYLYENPRVIPSTLRTNPSNSSTMERVAGSASNNDTHNIWWSRWCRCKGRHHTTRTSLSKHSWPTWMFQGISFCVENVICNPTEKLPTFV